MKIDPVDTSIEPPSVDEIISDGILAIVAGSDTTASSLCHILYCMLIHPETYKRLQAEVDQFYPPGEDSLSSQHHSKMTFLEAVM